MDTMTMFLIAAIKVTIIITELMVAIWGLVKLFKEDTCSFWGMWLTLTGVVLLAISSISLISYGNFGLLEEAVNNWVIPVIISGISLIYSVSARIIEECQIKKEKQYAKKHGILLM